MKVGHDALLIFYGELLGRRVNSIAFCIYCQNICVLDYCPELIYDVGRISTRNK